MTKREWNRFKQFIKTVGPVPGRYASIQLRFYNGRRVDIEYPTLQFEDDWVIGRRKTGKFDEEEKKLLTRRHIQKVYCCVRVDPNTWAEFR